MGKKPRRHDSDEEEEDEDELLSGSDDDGDALESGAAGPSGRGRANGAPGEREPIYNIEALHDKLEDIGWVEQAEWAETLTINHEDPTQVQDVDDDLARELAFYNQALSAAQQAIRRFEAAGIPWQRPPDYYAEMVKTDQHMAKVKEQLMAEQKQIEGAEERRKQREAKLYGKQVQQAKLLERQKDKKRQIEGISKLRKQREKSGFAGELDYDAEIKSLERDRLIPRGTPSMKKLGQRSPGADKGGPINKKRQARDAKFGYGGSKKLRKQNDAYSAADMDSYKPARFSDQFGGGSGGGPKGGKGGGGKFAGKGGGKFGGKGGGLGVKGGGVKKGGKQAPQQRPGKQRRQAMKGKGGR